MRALRKHQIAFSGTFIYRRGRINIETIRETKLTGSNAERVRIPVVSLDVDVCNIDRLKRKIGTLAHSRNGSYICVSTVHMVMEAYADPAFGSIVNGADIVVADGMPLVWMQRLQGVRNAERVRGNDLMIGLFEEAERTGLSVGFYGSKPEVLRAIENRLGIDYPRLDVAYSYSPPFRNLDENEVSKVISDIREKAPDLLFVGLGCPKQEYWMAKHEDHLTSLMIGVGAAFDFYAGNISEAPKWIQNSGFEWLFRLFQDPKRLWRRYLILNPRFVVLAITQLIRNRKDKT
ncbi:MAG: WecB/TagA/CpsF family glycosyltransferase [Acidobacteriota bacterium]|nr:WecB/TagA/CpsF family glycosyltransferase [Acidobacteriota bacterium]